MEEFYDKQSYTKTHNLIRWKSGKRVDPKLLGVLEVFGEMYVERPELFKKIFDEKYVELFDKVGNALKKFKKKKKARSMGRSMSMRAIWERGMDQDIERFEIRAPNVNNEYSRLERFKIRAPNVNNEYSKLGRFKIRAPKVIEEGQDGPKLGRFKIRAPNVIEEGQDGPNQGGPTKTIRGSFSDSK